MSGHSKWAGIKHKKAVVDARRGKLFAKRLRAIEVAAREGGGKVDANPTLADAVARARDDSIPTDTIERAIKRGTGELEGVTYETLTYEGYAPGGVAVLVDVLTDNRNRAAADVRRIFTRHGSNLAAEFKLKTRQPIRQCSNHPKIIRSSAGKLKERAWSERTYSRTRSNLHKPVAPLSIVSFRNTRQ